MWILCLRVRQRRRGRRVCRVEYEGLAMVRGRLRGGRMGCRGSRRSRLQRLVNRCSPAPLRELEYQVKKLMLTFPQSQSCCYPSTASLVW